MCNFGYGLDELDEHTETMIRNNIIELKRVKKMYERIIVIASTTPKKELIPEYYCDDLTPLKNLRLNEIILDGFNGCLDPLREMKIQKISLNCYNGDLGPLKSMSLLEISINQLNIFQCLEPF